MCNHHWVWNSDDPTQHGYRDHQVCIICHSHRPGAIRTQAWVTSRPGPGGVWGADR